MITYQLEPDLSADEFIKVLVESTLSERRPVNDKDRISSMLNNATIVVTARDNELLVGVSRAISDMSYCTYLSDLAVIKSHQGQGIGKELIDRTHQAAGLQSTLILLSAPKAKTYYPHIGMQAHDSCWTIPGTRPLTNESR